MGFVIVMFCIGCGCLWARKRYQIEDQHLGPKSKVSQWSHDPKENDLDIDDCYIAGKEIKVGEKDRKYSNSDIRLNNVNLQSRNAADGLPAEIEMINPEPKFTNGMDDFSDSSSDTDVINGKNGVTSTGSVMNEGEKFVDGEV